MKVIKIRYTRGDQSTQPGGIILRQKDSGEFVTHAFNRDAGSKAPREFFWGHYIDDEKEASSDFASRVAKARVYGDRGGGLIDQRDEDRVIDAETT